MYSFRNLSKKEDNLLTVRMSFEFKKYPTRKGININKVSCVNVSKKLKENPSASIEIMLNQKTVVNGVISDVNEVNETERGMLPFLKWVKIPDINPPGANKTIAIEIANILVLNTKYKVCLLYTSPSPRD